jgi:hypothetical protein
MSDTPLTQQEGKNYTNPAGDRFKCLPEFPYTLANKNSDGYFFGQGKLGDRYGHAGWAIVIAFALLFALMNYMGADKDGDIVSNLIHIFNFSFYNICFLLIIFLFAPFGYQFWVGRCKNNHPGSTYLYTKMDSLLAGMPFIASIILVIYPASLILSGNLTHWGHKATLIGILGLFGFYSSMEYWPAYIKNTVSYKPCVTGTGSFSPTTMTLFFYLGYAAIAGFVILLSVYWVWMGVTKKIEVVHGLNPIGMIRNILITIGLVLTNLFGGLKLYEAKDYKINFSN